MFDKEAIQSQQAFLKEQGMYNGPIDGIWGRDSQNAMRGWAHQHKSGNMDGSMFSLWDTHLPEGWQFNGATGYVSPTNEVGPPAGKKEEVKTPQAPSQPPAPVQPAAAKNEGGGKKDKSNRGFTVTDAPTTAPAETVSQTTTPTEAEATTPETPVAPDAPPAETDSVRTRGRSGEGNSEEGT